MDEKIKEINALQSVLVYYRNKYYELEQQFLFYKSTSEQTITELQDQVKILQEYKIFAEQQKAAATKKGTKSGANNSQPNGKSNKKK